MKKESYLAKRELLNNPRAKKEELIGWGDRYLQEGLIHDALAFYEKAGAIHGIEQVFEKAWREGDVFLIKHTARLLQRVLSSTQWQEVGRRAEEKQKYFFALQAYEEAGLEEEQARLSLTTALLLGQRALDTSPDHA